MTAIDAPRPAVPRRSRRLVLLVVLAVLVIAGAVIGIVVGTSSSPPAVAGPPQLTVVDKAHGGRFVISGTKKVFVLRGFDYQPLVHLGGNSFANESFSPSYYNHAQIVSICATWEKEGYNTVRVFLNPNQIGDPSGSGLDGAYMANLADFVSTAAAHHVRTLITVGELPTAGGFLPQAVPQFGYLNEDYLSPQFVTAEQHYVSSLISTLRQDRAPLSAVMWELKGELEFLDTAAPLSWTSGKVHTASGGTYNMASSASRVAMEDAAITYWANQMTSTIQQDVPGSLVGVGAYPPLVHHKNYVVEVAPLFQSSTKLSFVDIHAYPNLGPELAQIESFHASSTVKPVIMGEFGAVQKQSLQEAKQTLLGWQSSSCHLGGLSVTGWLMWTWNSSAQKEFWDALAGGGVLEHALAPVTRPNPCA